MARHTETQHRVSLPDGPTVISDPRGHRYEIDVSDGLATLRDDAAAYLTRAGLARPVTEPDRQSETSSGDTV